MHCQEPNSYIHQIPKELINKFKLENFTTRCP